MPRYFFDIHDGIQVFDDMGRELPGIAAAKSEAMRIASGFAADPRMIGESGGAIVVVIRDGPNSVASTIRLVFTIETPEPALSAL